MISCVRNLLLHLYTLHYFDQSFLFCVCVWRGEGAGGWLRGVNDPRAGFVRFCTQKGGEMSYKGGRGV